MGVVSQVVGGEARCTFPAEGLAFVERRRISSGRVLMKLSEDFWNRQIFFRRFYEII